LKARSIRGNITIEATTTMEAFSSIRKSQIRHPMSLKIS